MDEEIRLKAREYLLKTRLYRFIALCFLIAGVALFIVLYLRYIQGDALAALRQPVLVLILLIPFIPAAVLTSMAGKAQKNLMAIMDEHIKTPAEDTDKNA